MITKVDTSALIVDTARNTDMWCVFEHQVVLKEGDPPTVIQIGACKLTEVYRLTDGKTNSEWNDIFRNGGSVLVRIIGTTLEKAEAFRHATDLIRAMEPKPVCNLRGYNLRGQARAVRCLNNDRRYATQTEAANDLGISASGISRHLRGDLSHVSGFRFAFDGPSNAGDT